MNAQHLALGAQGEQAALEYFHRLGFRLEARNVCYPCGELDLVLVAPDGSLVVVEVKTRTSNAFGGVEAVTNAKFARIRKATAQWLLETSTLYAAVRFDVLIVYPTSNGPVFEHYQGVEHGAG